MLAGPIDISAAVLWCCERRLKGLRGRFAASRNIECAEPIIIPGGAKHIAMPSHPRDPEFIFEMIEMLRVSHGFTTLYVMAHIDCAACDGNKEPTYYETILGVAGDLLRQRFSGLEIVTVFVDVDGVYLVESEEVDVAAVA